MLEVVGVGKSFGPLRALDDVTLALRPGTVHGLLGENGAGKSTLVKCVMGYHRPDQGRLLLDGVERRIASPRDAHGLGIGMVYQHFTLVPNMTVAENLLLARSDLPQVIPWERERARLETFLAGVPFGVEPGRLAGSLAAGEKQKVEIIKQLFLDCRILILDEPTSVLTPGEADEILGLLRNMASAGRLTVLLITHKLREVMAFADEVTVLRRGRVAGRGVVADLTPGQMTEMMVGSHALAASAGRHPQTDGAVKLSVEGLYADDDKGARAVADVSFAVRAGEIVGIAGVSGNGQRQLVEVLAGQRRPTAGTIRIHDAPYAARRAEMHRHGVYCLPEEPLRNACVPRMTVAENLAFRSFDRAPAAVGGWFLNHRALRRGAVQLIDRYRIKASSTEAMVETLSGGNVQRLVLARELSGQVEVLIVANPCFGLDIAATADIRGQIMQVRNRGAGVLLVSEDLDELFELADRILVMLEGAIVYETPIVAADRAAIGLHMAGHRTSR